MALEIIIFVINEEESIDKYFMFMSEIFLQNAVPKSVIVLHGVEWPFLTRRHDE